MDPRYPIDKFEAKENYSSGEMDQFIRRIAAAPEKIEKAIQGLSPSQLDTPYREGGWTVRQVVYHLADSHMNAYIRMKWNITEDLPTIKAYNEKAWAETSEMKADPALSIQLLKALHAKWTTLLKVYRTKNSIKNLYTPIQRNPYALTTLSDSMPGTGSIISHIFPRLKRE